MWILSPLGIYRKGTPLSIVCFMRVVMFLNFIFKKKFHIKIFLNKVNMTCTFKNLWRKFPAFSEIPEKLLWRKVSHIFGNSPRKFRSSPENFPSENLGAFVTFWCVYACIRVVIPGNFRGGNFPQLGETFPEISEKVSPIFFGKKVSHKKFSGKLPKPDR